MRQILIWSAVILTFLDAALHLRRSLVPDGNPFGSPLHEQFLLYSLVAVVLALGLLVAPSWLGPRAWIMSAALIVWELGAIAVWFAMYHAPNPPGVVPDEGYVSKAIELLIIILLVPTLFMPAPRSEQVMSNA
ncbi:MAG: hypothetical protein JO023_05625 [Chloroflexi bacterium]|nr:hypothetical protein [Chloroflexota bacterium]